MTLPEHELDILRRMTPAQKLAVMNALIRQAYELRAAALRARWPDMPEHDVLARTRSAVGGECP